MLNPEARVQLSLCTCTDRQLFPHFTLSRRRVRVHSTVGERFVYERTSPLFAAGGSSSSPIQKEEKENAGTQSPFSFSRLTFSLSYFFSFVFSLTSRGARGSDEPLSWKRDLQGTRRDICFEKTKKQVQSEMHPQREQTNVFRKPVFFLDPSFTTPPPNPSPKQRRYVLVDKPE